MEDNTLTVYVKRLRKKLGNAVQISTVRGIGYRVRSVKKRFWNFHRKSRKPLRENVLIQGMRRKVPGVFLKMIFIH